MPLTTGDIVTVRFKNDSYISFIEYCFVNCLISGVHVKITGDPGKFTYTLLLFIAAPGVDRLEKAIQDFGPEVIP